MITTLAEGAGLTCHCSLLWPKRVQQEQSSTNSAGGLENTEKVQDPQGWRIQTPVHTQDARGTGGIYRRRVSCIRMQCPGASQVWQVVPAVNTPRGERLGGEGRREPNHVWKEMGLLLFRRRPQAAPSVSTVSPLAAEARITVYATNTEMFTPIPADPTQSLRKAGLQSMAYIYILILWLSFPILNTFPCDP